MNLVKIDSIPATNDLTKSFFILAMQNGITRTITDVQLRALATSIATAQAEGVNNWIKNW